MEGVKKWGMAAFLSEKRILKEDKTWCRDLTMSNYKLLEEAHILKETFRELKEEYTEEFARIWKEKKYKKWEKHFLATHVITIIGQEEGATDGTTTAVPGPSGHSS